MTNCIEVNGLQKVFGKNSAIKNIDLQIVEGEIFGLLGPSGAGKTTMIKMLTGELDKTAGDRKSTRLNSSHVAISYAVFCLKKKKHDRVPGTLKRYQLESETSAAGD